MRFFNKLFRKNADVNAQHKLDALMFASVAGRREVVQALLAQGADVNAKTIPDGITALMAASDKGHGDSFAAG